MWIYIYPGSSPTSVKQLFSTIWEALSWAYAAADAAAKSLQSCPTLCDPIDSSPPGFPVPEVLQARTLEWVAISFFNVWNWKVKVKSLSRVRLFVTPWTAAHQAPPSMGFSRQEYWSGVPLPSPPGPIVLSKSSKKTETHSSYIMHFYQSIWVISKKTNVTIRLWPIKGFFSSVQFNYSVMSDSLWPHGLQHPRLPCPSPTLKAYTNSDLSSQWYHPTISSSVIPFSSCFQSFPASGSFRMSWFFTSGGQNIGVSASASVLPMNIQDWFPLRWTGWISLQSRGLSRVFSNTTV